MKHEMEKNRDDHPQNPVDAGSTAGGGEFEGFEEFERFEGCQSEHEGGRAGASTPSNSSNPSNPLEHDKLEERFRKECRKTCRRNFWIELFKSAAKIAGVVLAALGLSSFNEDH